MQNINTTIETLSPYLFFILFLFSISTLIWNIFLQLTLRKIQENNSLLWKGEKVQNLEEVLLEQAKNLQTLDKDIHELFAISNEINNLATKSISRIAVVRFNPFKDIGGNQSFSIALLNGKNHGITITALYTKEGTRVYSKAITNGESPNFPLTEEEKKAIETAMSSENSIKKKK